MPSLPLLAGRYRLQSQIAAGGVGEVWRAEDILLMRPVAVKLLRAELAGHTETLARFRAEARHAGALSHPAIARVYDYGDPVPPLPAFLVMELVDGPSLAAVLSAAPLGAAQTMDVVAQVAAGLQIAHAAGLVHRDIKPANLLLGADGQVKITDFGIAHVAGSVPVTRTGIVMGTPAYLAPERVSGASATPAADLYSLGVVAYECLAGAAPFAGKPLEVAVAHRDLPLPPFPHPVPAGVAQLIGEMTAKDPAARPASAHEVATRAGGLHEDLVDGVAGGPASWRYSVPVTVADIPPPGPAATPDPTLGWQPPPANRTRRLAPAGHPAAGRPAPPGWPAPARRSRRTRWIAVAASTAAVAVLAAVVLAMTSSPGGSRVSAAGQTSPQTSRPAPPAPSHPATRSPSPVGSTVAAPATVEVTAATLVGEPVEQVRERLQLLGLVVQVQHNPSHQETGTVLAVTPSGKVRKASVIVVTVAVMQFQDGHDHHHHHGDGNGGQTVMSTGVVTAGGG
jgi:eukaryotic-like serine/threonine-protein kinase